MRCNGCPHESYDHQEGHPTCRLFGDDEDYVYENNKGELGCKYNRKSLQKFVRIHEREEEDIVKQMGDFVEFCKEYDKAAKAEEYK